MNDINNADEDVVPLYVDALAVFGNAVRDIADHEWDLPTPSTEWNVKEVVAHVVLGEAHLSSVLEGNTSATQSELSVELLGPSPLAAWRGTALRAIDAARVPGVSDTKFDLDMGTVEGRQLFGYRITDNVVHAWDLQVAVGRPVGIQDRFAEWLLDFWQPMAGQIAGSEFFAAPSTPSSGSASDRLLALLGRTPPPPDS
ncbi:MAG: TIGR03086 family metal-binding protein [Acidimicrobiales bacterium]|jgi:uncharacterized protein (TIGR03086 family)